VVKLVPEAKRDLTREALTDSGKALRLWLKAQLVAMVLIGLLTGIGLWILGVPSALALGIIAGLLEFVPFVGPIIAAIPAVLIALAIDPQLALWTVLLYVLIQNIEGYAVQPIIQSWAVEVPGAVLLFALLASGALFGPLGVIFAAPLTVVVYVLVKRLYVREALDTPTPIPGEDQPEMAPVSEA
jgi:predicted PurR-regulated permease PerM